MGLFDRLRKAAAPALIPVSPPRPPAQHAALGGSGGSDSDDSADDHIALPPRAAAEAPLSAPARFAPRRGAFDLAGDSLSDSGQPGRRSSAAAAAARQAALPGGSEVDALYSDIALVHRGGMSSVYRARDRRSRHRVALKAYPRARRNATAAAALEREQRMLRLAAPHEGVVSLERVLESSDATYLVLEAAPGGTLMEAIATSGGRLADRITARRVAAPLLAALAHLHSRGIVHRDLKPEHVLLMPDGLRLADFSSAACTPGAPALQPLPPDISRRANDLRRSIEVLAARHRRSAGDEPQQPQQEGKDEGRQQAGGEPHRDVLNHRAGSVEYMAPEMLAKPTAAEVFHLVIAHGMDEEELPTYDEKVDVWSAGALLFECLTGRQPFLADGAAATAALVAERLAGGPAAFVAAAMPSASAEARDFVARCFEPRPTARLSAAELLLHPWLRPRASLGEVPGPEAAAAEGRREVKSKMSRCMSEQVLLLQPQTHTCDSDPGLVASTPLPPTLTASDSGPLDGAHGGGGGGSFFRSEVGPLQGG